jgi:hypothetical protein
MALVLLLGGPLTAPAWSGGSQVVAARASGDGLIAYVGSDNTIWVMNADGTNARQVTTGVESTSPAVRPAWSHDGTMLAFSNYGNGVGSGDGIWVVRDGALSRLPNTERCTGPAFSADDTRILYGCANGEHREEQPGDLETNPARAFVSSSALDGSDQRVEIPYRTDGKMPAWDNSSFRGSPTQVDVSAVTGEILVVASGLHYKGAFRFGSDGALISTIAMKGDGNLGPWVARFMPDGQSVLVTTCSSGCFPGAANAPVHNVLQLDLEGNEIREWPVPSSSFSAGVSPSPDGRMAVVSLGGEPAMHRIDPDGNTTVLGPGADPAWQPVPAQFTLPDGTQAGGTDHDSAGAVPTPGPTAATAGSGPEGSAATTTPTGQNETSGAGGPISAQPTSGQLAFSARDGGQWDLYLHDFGSGGNVQLTSQPSDEWAPAFSHDGTRLAYLSDQSGSNQVWTMNPDGSNPMQVSSWDGHDQITYVDWSGNNETLYITMQADTVKYVMQMPASGGELTPFITFSSARPQVLPDGTCYFITDNETRPRIVMAHESDPTSTVSVADGDALQFDPSGTYGVYQAGDPNATDGRHLEVLGVGVVRPRSGYDDSNPVITGPTDADHILWVVDDGTGTSIWSANLTQDGTELLMATVDTGNHESIWYLAWRPGVTPAPGRGA